MTIIEICGFVIALVGLLTQLVCILTHIPCVSINIDSADEGKSVCLAVYVLFYLLNLTPN